MRQMKICPNHSDYIVPMISTLAFSGAEFWCPYCEHTTGWFGDYEERPPTMELVRRRKKYHKLVQPYLGAIATLNCCALIWPPGSGIRIDRKDLPKDEEARCYAIYKAGFAYEGIRVEEVTAPGEGDAPAVPQTENPHE
jgi:hypothetical protein